MKIDVIEHILWEEGIQICSLSETDFPDTDQAPVINGYRCIVAKGPVVRLCVYVREGIEFEHVSYPGNIPAVVINTSQATLGFVYSESWITRAPAGYCTIWKVACVMDQVMATGCVGTATFQQQQRTSLCCQW